MRKSVLFFYMSFAILFAASLSGCNALNGPTYEYTAPGTPQGKRCVTMCMQIKEHCIESCNWQEQACKDRANLLKESDQFSAKLSCDFDNSHCSDRCYRDYRQCYTDCGGTVKEVEQK